MQVLEWPEPTRSSQRLDVLVTGWSLHVSSESLNQFNFEGECDTNPLKGLEVSGEFVIRGSLLHPLSWRSMPHLENTIVEGWGTIYSYTHTYPPTLSFTLSCSSAGLEWLYRTFLAGFAISENRLWPLILNLEIEPPDAGLDASGDQDLTPVEDFWRERWKSACWRVSHWELHMNVKHERPTSL